MWSTRYPELYVADLDVKFRGGVADVRSQAKLAALARIDGIGIEKAVDKSSSGQPGGTATDSDGDGQAGDDSAGSGDGDPSDTGDSDGNDSTE